MSLNPSRIHLIWITPKFPLGNPDGARHATCTLIRQLTKRDVAIDLICLLPEGESADIIAAKRDLGVSSGTLIRRSNSRFLPIPGLGIPFTFRTFAAQKVRAALKQEIARLIKAPLLQSNTFLVFDGLHTFGALRQEDLKGLSAACQGIIYRAHNVEFVLWEQSADQACKPWLRWLFNHQATLVKTFEQRIARLVTLIAPVSKEDAAKFKHLAPTALVSVTPIGIDFPEKHRIQAVRESPTLELLFVGRLDWRPNRNGLSWFLENIWPRITVRRRLSLKIAGVGDGRWLERFRPLAGIHLLGKVVDIAPLYESCSLSIAPLFQGSGTRVKILESARYQRAVLTTAQGAEGLGLIPGISYFHAENEKEWLALLETITIRDCRTVGGRAFQAVYEQFDGQRIADRFLRQLEHPDTLISSAFEAVSSIPSPLPVEAGAS